MNLLTPRCNDSPEISGEAVRSQEAKAHRTGEWFRTAFGKAHGLDLLQPSVAFCAIGDTPWSCLIPSFVLEPSRKMEGASEAVNPICLGLLLTPTSTASGGLPHDPRAP